MSVLSHVSKLGDTIWLRDYHVSLLPNYSMVWNIRNIINGKSVSRHIRYSSYIFHSPRHKSLENWYVVKILHADVVGDHARNHVLNATSYETYFGYELCMVGRWSVVGGQWFLITLNS